MDYAHLCLGNRMKPEPIALVDMDGTLCDFDGAMKLALEELRSPSDPEVVLDGPSDNDPPWLEARKDLIRNQSGFWSNLNEIPTGFKILELLEALDFKIHILTKGPRSSLNAWSEKVQWVQEHVSQYEGICIVQDKGLVYGKVLVDDWPPYIDRWLKWRPRGTVIVPPQPWNVGVVKATWQESSEARILRTDGSKDSLSVVYSVLQDCRESCDRGYP